MDRWAEKIANFLRASGAISESEKFAKLVDFDEYVLHNMRLGHLYGVLSYYEMECGKQEPVDFINAAATISYDHKKVFVVHGHDEAAKNAVARFLEKLGLNPIILNEKPSGGRTIIEKFETYSRDVGFAVILLTPDDVGGINNTSLSQRARQNVVLELGYFMGRLSRGRVCALYKEGVELPSDIHGVIYIEMDNSGGWTTKLAHELEEANISIQRGGLLGV